MEARLREPQHSGSLDPELVFFRQVDVGGDLVSQRRVCEPLIAVLSDWNWV